MTRASADKARFGVGLLGLAAVSVIAWWLLWAAIAPPLFGWSPVAVTSGSMEPHIGAGDVVFVAASDGHDLTPGTVIVFADSTGGRVTHRIVDLTPDGEYVTRGDAVGRIDSTPVAPGDVEGVGRMIVPLIGHPIVWVEAGQWLHLLVAAIAVSVAAWASRWALLRRYNPWRVEVRAPAAPPDPPRRSRPVPSVAAALLVVTVALLTLAATATRTRAAFDAATDDTGSTVNVDALDPPTSTSPPRSATRPARP